MATLKDLNIGDKAVFLDSPMPELMLKLNEMGIFPGDHIEVKNIAPWASSFLVEVKNKLDFTISDEDAAFILIDTENVSNP
ncbi:MAG: ferrous iron transport protein A [Bacteroidia bacterium]|nr:ferrous iron transport protein A [Bacteroidia bacterium]